MSAVMHSGCYSSTLPENIPDPGGQCDMHDRQIQTAWYGTCMPLEKNTQEPMPPHEPQPLQELLATIGVTLYIRPITTK